MKLKHREIEIDPINPFLNCKLKRDKYANVLTQIIHNYADGFVLAINNEWGTGKTTFVKMWQQQLLNQNFKTLYFNAWENDYESEPMVALLSELKTLTPKTTISKTFKKVLKNSVSLSKNLFPILIRAVVEKYVNTESIKDAIDKISVKAADLFEEEIKEYADKKQSLEEFKLELKNYIKEECNGLPLVFIIDELDRCKPDYAVQVLECVKHFFNVEGIVFVLSIDKEQLSNAIKGFYGSEGIDSISYLKRFIDIEYHLPAPGIKEFVDYLYQYFNLNDFFGHEDRVKYQQLNRDHEHFKKFTESIFIKKQLSLRDQERLFASTRLILSQFEKNQFVLPTVLFTLIYLKQYNNKLYKEIRFRSLNVQEFIDHIEPFFIEIENSAINVKYNFSLIVVCYQKYLEENNNYTELVNSSSETQKLLFKTKFDELKIIKLIHQISIGRGEAISMQHLFSKIELTSELVSFI